MQPSKSRPFWKVQPDQAIKFGIPQNVPATLEALCNAEPVRTPKAKDSPKTVEPEEHTNAETGSASKASKPKQPKPKTSSRWKNLATMKKNEIVEELENLGYDASEESLKVLKEHLQYARQKADEKEARDKVCFVR